MGSGRQRAPVALLIFNRPRATRRVLEAIMAAKPSKLFVIADGPRPHCPADAALCEETRRVIERADRDMEVIRDYSEANLGCGRRVATGITRVFEQVEETILLEDDCLPDPSFFGFCDALLERYRDDERIMMVNGTNDLVQWRPQAQSYHCSRYGSIWGWASWRRAWSRFDLEMKSWALPESRLRLAESLGDEEQAAHRSAICDRAFRGEVDTWDYQWTYARLVSDGLALVPSRNLVSNIGFDGDATHTSGRWSDAAQLPRFAADSPLRPPASMEADSDYDRWWFEWQVGRPSVEAVAARAEAMLTAKRYAQTLLLVNKWLGRPSFHESRPMLLVLRARALIGIGHPAAALDALDEVLAISPEGEEALRLWHQVSGSA